MIQKSIPLNTIEYMSKITSFMYVVIDDENPDKIIEIRRFLYNKQNQKNRLKRIKKKKKRQFPEIQNVNQTVAF